MGGDGGKFTALFTGKLELDCVGTMMCYVLIFTIIFEALVDKGDRVFEPNLAHTAIYNKMIRELMIMGFVGFCLAISTEVTQHTHEELLCFEFADLLTFFIAILYVVDACVIMVVMNHTQSNYDRIQITPVEDILDRYMQEDGTTCSDVVECRSNKSCAAFFCLGGYSQPQADTRWKFMQLSFVWSYKLSSRFDYLRYTKYHMEKYIVKYVQISSWTWCCVLAIVVGCTVMTKGGVGFVTTMVTEMSNITLGDDAGKNGATQRRSLGARSGHDTESDGSCCVFSASFQEPLLDMCRNVSSALLSQPPSGVSNLSSDPLHQALCARNACPTHMVPHTRELVVPTLDVVLGFAAIGWSLCFLQYIFLLIVRSRTNNFFVAMEAGERESLVKRVRSLAAIVDAMTFGSDDTLDVKIQRAQSGIGTRADIENMFAGAAPAPDSSDSSDDDADNVVDDDLEHYRMEGHASTPDLYVEHGVFELSIASDIFTLRAMSRLSKASQAVSLSNALYMSFFLCHMAHTIQPAFENRELQGWQLHGSVWGAVLLIVAPYLLNMLVLNPIRAMRMSLLQGMLRLDMELAEKVMSWMHEIVDLRTRIRQRLQHMKTSQHSVSKKKATKRLEVVAAVCCEMHAMITDAEHELFGELRQESTQDSPPSTPGGTKYESMVNIDLRKLQHMHESMEGVTRNPQKLELFNRIIADADQRTEADGVVTLEHLQFANERRFGHALNGAWEAGLPADVRDRVMAKAYASGWTMESLDQVKHLAKALAMFKAADVNNSLELDSKELTRFLNMYKCGLSKAESSRMFNIISGSAETVHRVTADGDKRITVEDWELFLMSSDEELMDRVYKSSMQALADQNLQGGHGGIIRATMNHAAELAKGTISLVEEGLVEVHRAGADLTQDTVDLLKNDLLKKQGRKLEARDFPVVTENPLKKNPSSETLVGDGDLEADSPAATGRFRTSTLGVATE